MPMLPGEQSTVLPVTKFYIGTGSSTVGEVMVVRQLGRSIMIDL